MVIKLCSVCQKFIKTGRTREGSHNFNVVTNKHKDSVILASLYVGPRDMTYSGLIPLYYNY